MVDARGVGGGVRRRRPRGLSQILVDGRLGQLIPVDDEEAATQAVAVVLKSTPDTGAAPDRAQAPSKQQVHNGKPRVDVITGEECRCGTTFQREAADWQNRSYCAA